jgi:hypothetical protein
LGAIVNIIDEDKQYLLASMKAGEVVLILGAGASATSLNSQSKPVKQSGALAATIAERAGLPYDKEKMRKF